MNLKEFLEQNWDRFQKYKYCDNTQAIVENDDYVGSLDNL